LAERLWTDGSSTAGAWNFGPGDEDARPVGWLADELARRWGGGAGWEVDGGHHPHEAGMLKLDCAKARGALGWRPRLRIETALDWVVAWYRQRHDGGNAGAL